MTEQQIRDEAERQSKTFRLPTYTTDDDLESFRKGFIAGAQWLLSKQGEGKGMTIEDVILEGAKLFQPAPEKMAEWKTQGDAIEESHKYEKLFNYIYEVTNGAGTLIEEQMDEIIHIVHQGFPQSSSSLRDALEKADKMKRTLEKVYERGWAHDCNFEEREAIRDLIRIALSDYTKAKALLTANNTQDK